MEEARLLSTEVVDLAPDPGCLLLGRTIGRLSGLERRCWHFRGLIRSCV